MRGLIAMLLAGSLLTAACGSEEPARRAGPECPQPPEATLRTLGEMRQAARQVKGPEQVRRIAAELAKAHADDWLGREDLLAQLAGRRECRQEAAALAERLRVPHYRQVVGRLRRTHSLRNQLLDNWDDVVTRKLAFAVSEYRMGLDGTAGDLQGVQPPRHVRSAAHRALMSATVSG